MEHTFVLNEFRLNRGDGFTKKQLKVKDLSWAIQAWTTQLDTIHIFESAKGSIKMVISGTVVDKITNRV